VIKHSMSSEKILAIS